MRSESLRNKQKRKKVTLKTRVGRLLLKLRGKKTLHFIHIGKTGGSAIKYALQSADVAGSYKLRFHSHNVTLFDIPEGDAVFFVIRDPVSRFVSAFYSRKRQGRPKYDRPWSEGEKKAFRHFSTANQLALALSANTEEERSAAEQAMVNIEHVEDFYWDWFGDEDYLLARKQDILFVGRQEFLAEDFERLKHRLALPESLHLPVGKVEAHRSESGEDTSLDLLGVENLKRWYAADYKFVEVLRDFI